MRCKLVYPGQFVAFVTCMLKDYEDAILGGMVKKGYSVGIVSQDGNLSHGHQGGAAYITVFRVDSTKEEIAAKDIHKDLMEVMREHKFLYYSIVVSALVDACWISTNITLPQPSPPPTPPEPPVTEPDKSNLN